MSKRFMLLSVILIGATFLMFSVILEKPVVHAQVATFMKSPYFGTKAVSVVFDHEYPVYDLEDNGNPYEGDPRTVVHRDGVSRK